MDIQEKPFFSIVIPVYNREKEIRRALNSCLTQTYTDLEVIVVDDASLDKTVVAAEEVAAADRRVRLYRHPQNKGVCPARNTGIDHCRGEWVLFLDSDDELLPGALHRIWQLAHACPETIGRLGFAYRRDDGGTCPQPLVPDSVLDYAGYLAWSDGIVYNDFFHCTRRRLFSQVRFPDSRAYEAAYLLNSAQACQTRLLPEIVAVIHTDSANRDSNLSAHDLMTGFLRTAANELAAVTTILNRHGTALARNAPGRYRVHCREQITFTLLTGRRLEGSRLAALYLARFPFCLKTWVIWLVGLFGPLVLARVKALVLRGGKT